MHAFLGHIRRLPRTAIASLITLYQATLSPDHGWMRHLFPYGYCPHHPTCSRYAKEAVLRRGALIGSLLAAWRIVRCTPWTTPSDEKLRALASSQAR